MPIEPTPKLLNILYTLANGKLPWGVEWDRFIPLCRSDDGFEYILCCEHTLKYHGGESAEVVGAGLLLPGPPDEFDRPTLVITKAGREYLARFEHMVEFDG